MDQNRPRVIPMTGFKLRDAFSVRCRISVSCWGCKRREELDMMKIVHQLGPDTFLHKLDEKLKCRACGCRMVTIHREWAD